MLKFEFMYEYRIKEIVRVVDGDTVDVVIDVGFSLFLKQRVRLRGINCPELHRSKSAGVGAGEMARDYAQKWFDQNPKLLIRTYKDDKYGRLLAEIISADTQQSINQDLIKTGHASPHNGRLKP